ncbi:hypothetical protein K493DRAFT_317706 [Basidiobolus meristosporus CBS 931.73]|uniref:Uncharacterized protein n=1 Tax=Basidiobolus meristosporus CBS 931.73 TaxID=1314790 RepID=A0A1Y1XYW5_9FUNG|nr:hypothetical protein K493DRAFT_317706 [Basidiobolus meristosporus CBS 931.73]|eukprot:ORX90845.1 hypothetical protein K493DRAFT_317706 [Basidiobolus meristosporus CBS 931.73]
MVLINAAALSLLISTSSAMFVAFDSQAIDHRLLARSQDHHNSGYDTSDYSPDRRHEYGSRYNDDVDADYHGNDHDSRYHGKTGRSGEEYSYPDSRSYSLSVEYDESHDHKPNSIKEVAEDNLLKPADDEPLDDATVSPPTQASASADSDISPTPPPAAESNTSPCTKAVDLDLKLLGDSAVKACAL